MREPIWLLERRCRNGRFSSSLIRAYPRLLLTGLDYLHSECHIVHTGRLTAIHVLSYIQARLTDTDIKLDKIMVGFENHSVLGDFSRAQSQEPMSLKVQNGRMVYQSHRDFGPLRSSNILAKIADFGLAQYGTNEPQRHPIQSNHYRAPEVILGAGWTYSVDIWNLGVLVCFDFHTIYNSLTCRDKDLESTGKKKFI